jgi:uncharacterized protein (DUF302 family)
MRKAVYGVILGTLVGFSAIAADNGLIVKPSRYEIGETLDRLEAAVKEAGNTVVARIDHAGAAKSAGQDLRPTRLLIWGNPAAGTPLMAAAPTLAIDLPQKFLAWTDQDGKTWVAYNSMAYLAQRHGLSQSEKVKAIDAWLDGLTDKALK